MAERVDGTNIDLEESPDDGAPPEEAARLRRTLAQRFPAAPGRRRTFRIVMAWSRDREAWTLSAANERLAEFAWGDRTNEVAEVLASAGHTVDVEKSGSDRRRSVRRFARLPVRLEDDDGHAVQTTTVNISEHGVSVLSPRAIPKGGQFRLTEPERGGTCAFRVVWCGREEGGQHKVGAEMVGPEVDFWGPAYGPSRA